jgi:hypothetical protein
MPTDLASCSSPEEMEDREVVEVEASGESKGEFPASEVSTDEAVTARLEDGLCRRVGAIVNLQQWRRKIVREVEVGVEEAKRKKKATGGGGESRRELFDLGQNEARALREEGRKGNTTKQEEEENKYLEER